jgi:rod shape-determining protein MreC
VASDAQLATDYRQLTTAVDNIITRHRNLTILGVVLFAQLFGLAYQVKRTTDRGSTRLVRVWAVTLITPLEKAVVHSVSWAGDAWRNYVYLRDVRRENDALRQEIQRLQLEQVRLSEDAGQARRLQALLGFKEQFISQTLAAQVISTTGSEFSRGIYIDKGSHDGLKPDMPVITAEGVVGKVFRVYPTSSLVLQINDPSSGAGVILEKSRLQGILKGSSSGETFVANIMADEQVQPGEQVLTSGGDRIYPKGLAVGTVSKVSPAGTFLDVRVRPAARLNRLEEVLVITRIVEKSPEVNQAAGPMRAIDILAGRLPSVPPPKPPANQAKADGNAAVPAATTNTAAQKPGATQTPAAPKRPVAGETPALQSKPSGNAAGAAATTKPKQDDH